MWCGRLENHRWVGRTLTPERPIVIDRGSNELNREASQAAVQVAFESFISVPIMARDGQFWGTLFGIDSVPRALSEGAGLASMTLFSALISQQLKIQEELEDTRVALMDATATAELREQFIAVLGHDLRNPIGNVITSADLMMLSLDNPERLKILAKLVQGSARRMAALVDDVVDLTRGKLSGGMGLTLRSETDLCGLIALVVNELRSSYPAREIRFEASDGGAVLCDGGRLAQLCSNLLKNALVYGDPSQPVAVSIMINEAGLELAVSNHGPQLSADTISHLFEPYWRAKGPSAHQGWGLACSLSVKSPVVTAARSRSCPRPSSPPSSSGSTRRAMRGPPRRLYLHLRAKLNDAIRRNLEIVRCVARVARHDGIEMFTPWHHPFAWRRNHGLARNEE